MMQVILKIIQRSYFGKYSFGYLFMCTEDFFEAVTSYTRLAYCATFA